MPPCNGSKQRSMRRELAQAPATSAGARTSQNSCAPRVPSISERQRSSYAAVACQAETPTTPEVQPQPSPSQPASLNPWQWYCIRLEKNPFLTKACTSFCGFMLGDVLAQKLEGAPSTDLGRTLHLGLYGLLLDGPIGHMWYKWLDGTVDKALEDPRGTVGVAIKTSADQLVWAPIMTFVFFSFLKTLEGHPELAIATASAKTLSTVAANYVIWPAAHIVSFKYVPSHQRILYNNVIAIFWNCYLSIVASGGMDAAGLAGAGVSDASQLAGLHDIAMRVQATLPYNGYWIRELLDLNNPIGTSAARLAARGASSPFIESVLQAQSMAMGR